MAKTISPYGNEPTGISHDQGNYTSRLSAAFNWYNQEKEKKDARNYLRQYTFSLNKNLVKHIDDAPDQAIICTYGWLARLIVTGSSLSPKHLYKLTQYIDTLTAVKVPIKVVEVAVSRPSVRENMEEKVKELLGELEGALDEVEDFNMYQFLQSRNIPAAYAPYVMAFIQRKANEFIFVYESSSPDIKEGYSNFGKRKLTSVLKLLGQWKEDLEKYSQFKKANKKPRPKKIKSPIEQVSKLKYCKSLPDLNLTSINPVEIIGASQVWLYNSRYKKLAVYRSESSTGIQVKGNSLQNYDPDLCEQKSIRKPKETLLKVLESGKVQLRKLMSELNSKDSSVSGRINEDCLIVRVIK